MRTLKRSLRDPKKGFEWPNGIEGYTLDSTTRGPADDTGVGSPKIWTPVQYIVQQGFKQYGEWEVAREVAERYFTAVVAAYKKGNMIREALNAAQPQFEGHESFVGWGGLAPIANLIEYALGFNVVAPDRTIEWRIGRQDRHGIERLPIGEVSVNLLCEARRSAKDPCHLTCESTGDITLKVFVQDRPSVHRLSKGRTELVVS